MSQKHLTEIHLSRHVMYTSAIYRNTVVKRWIHKLTEEVQEITIEDEDVISKLRRIDYHC